jgi:hypothetical protein
MAELPVNEILEGDCLEIMKEHPDCTPEEAENARQAAHNDNLKSFG